MVAKPKAILVEASDDEDFDFEAPRNTDGSRRARVKGTWTMFYGGEQWDFVDRKSYDLPEALYQYLKDSGNIYDVL